MLFWKSESCRNYQDRHFNVFLNFDSKTENCIRVKKGCTTEKQIIIYIYIYIYTPNFDDDEMIESHAME